MKGFGCYPKCKFFFLKEYSCTCNVPSHSHAPPKKYLISILFNSCILHSSYMGSQALGLGQHPRGGNKWEEKKVIVYIK